MTEPAEYSFDFNPRQPEGVPLELWGRLLRAVSEAAEQAGYDCFFKAEDGLGVAHVRKRPSS